MRRRVISVTRRHIDFLFNREETVMCGHSCRLGDGPSGCYKCELVLDELRFSGEGDHQLPPSDESKVGQD